MLLKVIKYQFMKVSIKYYCKICGLKVSKQANLTRHINSKHKEKNYVYFSDKEYRQSTQINRHTISAFESVKYECNICQSKFLRKSALTTHIKSVHFEKKYLL